MAILPITIWGEPVLHAVAKPVTAFDDALAGLIVDMYETMEAAPGVGLAAPQIGLPLRVFVYDWTDREGVRTRGVAINPELFISPTVPLSVEELREEPETEGCLSVPGEAYPLRRAHRARLRAQDEKGQWYELEAEGWLARILQHEYDHLNGVIYINRLDFMTHRKALKEMAKAGLKGGTWMPGEDEAEAGAEKG